jgi:uncharacterized protein (DUF697 family)
MSVTLKLAHVWRVLRDVNLEAIRSSAAARFVIPVVAEDLADADGLAALLSGSRDDEPHPWLVAVRAGSGVPSLPQRPLAAVIVARVPRLSASLTACRAAFLQDGIPVVTAVAGDGAARDVPEPGEAARITAPAIDSRLGRQVATALLDVAGPDWQLALARQLPPLREQVVATLIEETAQANAGYALASGVAEIVPVLTAPLNLGDVIVLSKNQLVMSYRIALACGSESETRRLVPEIVGVIGGGLLLRQLARQLVGFIPLFGIVPKVAIAYGGTYAIGRAVEAWAREGRAASAETLRQFSREGLARGREIAKKLRAAPRRRLVASSQDRVEDGRVQDGHPASGPASQG